MEEKIFQDMRSTFGLRCENAVPVSGGWLNRKWRVFTQEGEFLVKQFSQKRYGKDLTNLEAALQRQVFAKSRGVPCPALRLYKGQAIRQIDQEISYTVMEFCPGVTEAPAAATTEQLRSLGAACGKLHQAFVALPPQKVKGYPFRSSQLLQGLRAHYRACREDPLFQSEEAFRQAVLAQEPILEQVTESFLDRLPRGIGHEDFAADNLLFLPDSLSAIVDFDRSQYGFAWHDAGRALLSLALQDGVLHRKKAEAFREGFSAFLPLSRHDLADALRLTWCLEMPWWILPRFFQERPTEKVERFLQELLWLTEQWFELDTMLEV